MKITELKKRYANGLKPSELMEEIWEKIAVWDDPALFIHLPEMEELVALAGEVEAIDRRDAIGPAFDALVAVVAGVLPIEFDDVTRARRLVVTTPRLSARDAIHLAVMQRRNIGRIMSFDRGFDDVPGITRLG